MKLSPLLAEFLTTNKQLSLTGIGRFELDDAGTISFHQDTSVKEDPELVGFIAGSSGKMKSLVSADLDSHLELARQLLHIGKPYLFEGIGTLSKNKFGNYDFFQINVASDKTRDKVAGGNDMTSTTENSFTDYEEMFSPKKPKAPPTKKIITWMVALTGLLFAVFGGYVVYNKTKNKKDVVKNQEPVAVVPQDSLPKVNDSIPTVAKPADSSGLYRFVIETAGRQRAFKRYAMLKGIFVDVRMDTKDSIVYKLYIALPAAPADTARIRDSLGRLYSTRGRPHVELN